jgi:hypothetical protein
LREVLTLLKAPGVAAIATFGPTKMSVNVGRAAIGTNGAACKSDEKCYNLACHRRFLSLAMSWLILRIGQDYLFDWSDVGCKEGNKKPALV